MARRGRDRIVAEVESSFMIKRSIHHYFWFGTCAQFLLFVDPGLPLRVPSRRGVLDNIEGFFSYLDKLGLQVTARTTSELKDLAERFRKAPGDSRISVEQVQELSRIMVGIRTTLEAEMQGFNAYIVTPKRLDVDKLLEDIPSLLAPGVYQALPSIAQFDLMEAGKCIAFERSTAAAFHILRGTECVLRAFYCAIVKQKRVSFMWGNMVEDLRGRRKARQYQVLLDNLDNIRRSFRNPTQHPELTYDIHEVQDLWGLCVDAVNRMAKALK